ncbi:uncharacterized protein [Pseudorasbora parva]|uniref:uncharacterized protein n=1 Tax=Pseudorasbora parva TaxID=51549 RepID=UPI00351E7CE3
MKKTNLSFSDAGKYFLKVFTNTNQTELDHQIRTYQLHIHDEIFVKKHEELKLDVLFSNAKKVETNSSGEWTEVWKEGDGLKSERLNVSDVDLIINSFSASDAGTYRVLDSKQEILITVTLRLNESMEGLKDIRDNKTNDTEQGTTSPPEGNFTLPAEVCFWFLVALVVLGVLMVLMVGLLVRVLVVLNQIKSDVKKCQSQHRSSQEKLNSQEKRKILSP